MSRPGRKYRGLDTDPGWINRRFRDIERQLREMRAARRLQAASIGEGGITVKEGGGVTLTGGGGVTVEDGGGITVEDGGGITIEDGGNLRILGASGEVVFSASDGPLKAATVQQDNNSLDLTQDAWTQYLLTTVPVPEGFTTAYVLCFASAGVTLTESGNVGAQAMITGVSGPPISNGVSAASAVSASSFVAAQVTDLGPDKALQVAMQAAQVAGSPQAGSGNVHLSASITFLR